MNLCLGSKSSEIDLNLKSVDKLKNVPCPVVGSNRKILVLSFIKLSSFVLFHHHSILHSNFSKIFKFNKFLKLIFFIFNSSLWFSSFFRKCEKDEF